MRTMVVRRYGRPEVFEAQQAPDPQPKPGEVVIRVKAIGVNFADLLQRMGSLSRHAQASVCSRDRNCRSGGKVWPKAASRAKAILYGG